MSEKIKYIRLNDIYSENKELIFQFENHGFSLLFSKDDNIDSVKKKFKEADLILTSWLKSTHQKTYES